MQSSLRDKIYLTAPLYLLR